MRVRWIVIGACLTFSAGPALAQEAPGTQQQGSVPPALLADGFRQVNEWVAKAAALVPADKYAYRPAESVRTFGQLVAHIADSYKYYCAAAKQRGVQWTDAIEKGTTDKAAVVKQLEDAAAACATAYASGGNAKPMMENIAHTNLHYGNIITYMRMMGLVPPSS